jgi:hypothetical protein
MAVLGCSRPPVDGTVYVTKGAGTVVRAAAVAVHTLPYESVEAFERARRAEFERVESGVVAEYLIATCRTFEASRANFLKRKSTELEESADRCTIEPGYDGVSSSEFPDLDSVHAALAQQRVQRAALQQDVAATLAREGAGKITVSYDYAAGDFGVVRIANGSDYWLTTGAQPYGSTVSGFVQGVRVISCQLSQAAIAPGSSLRIDLGACVTDSANLETLLQKRLASVCRKTGYLDVPCFDDFGPEDFDLQTPGNYRRSDWTFADRIERPSLLESDYEFVAVDFERLAERSESVREATARGAALEAALLEAAREAARWAQCESLATQIELLKSGACPEAGQGRSVASTFGRLLSAIGMTVGELPTPPEETIATFAGANASAVTRTNVDGQFSLAAPPRARFLVYASYNDSFSALEWLVPVAEDATAIELNNTNALGVRTAP